MIEEKKISKELQKIITNNSVKDEEKAKEEVDEVMRAKETIHPSNYKIAHVSVSSPDMVIDIDGGDTLVIPLEELRKVIRHLYTL